MSLYYFIYLSIDKYAAIHKSRVRGENAEERKKRKAPIKEDKKEKLKVKLPKHLKKACKKR